MIGDRAIVLVEDDPDDEMLIRRMLTRAGVVNDIVVAHDGVDALEILLGRRADGGAGGRPALVLLDLCLPFVNGLEVLERLRANERTKDVPVIVLTIADADAHWYEAFRMGVAAFIRKPFSFAELAAAVGRLGLSWTLVGSPPAVERSASAVDR